MSRTTKITVAGESLVDVVEPSRDAVALGATAVEHPGGGPMNIALGLARLGRAVTLVTAFGADARGQAIEHHLRSSAVEIAAGSIRDEPTSSATAHLKPDGAAEYEFDLRWSLPVEFGPTDPAVQGASLIHVGSIGAFLEPGGSSVASLLDELDGAAGEPIVTFDPNMRPSIIGDHAAAITRFERIARRATIVKLSDEDAAWLYPGLAVNAVLDTILSFGPSLVAVTLGGEGAVLATSTDRMRVAGLIVDVADTIGAGDSFMSALIDKVAQLIDDGVGTASLRDGSAFSAERLAAIGGFAVRCAAITVSRPGADPPTRDELGRAPAVA